MNDFKSYSQNGKNQNTTNTGNGGPNTASGAGVGNGGNGGVYGNNSGNSEADLKQTTDMMTMIAKAFNGKSEAQIWQAILAQAEEGKRNGTLTNADIDNFYNTVAPMLDGFKRKKLKEVIARLKSI